MEPGKNHRDIKLLKLYSLLLTVIAVILLVKGLNNDQAKIPDIIRVQGIIVEWYNDREQKA